MRFAPQILPTIRQREGASRTWVWNVPSIIVLIRRHNAYPRQGDRAAFVNPACSGRSAPRTYPGTRPSSLRGRPGITHTSAGSVPGGPGRSNAYGVVASDHSHQAAGRKVLSNGQRTLSTSVRGRRYEVPGRRGMNPDAGYILIQLPVVIFQCIGGFENGCRAKAGAAPNGSGAIARHWYRAAPAVERSL